MTSYWLSDICSLTNSINVNPLAQGDKNYRYNSLTRLIILVTAASAILFPETRNEILLGGVISVFISIIIYMLTYNSSGVSGGSAELKTKDTLEEVEERLGQGQVSIEIIDDKYTNDINNVTLDYTPPNTNLKKEIIFNKYSTPSNVTKTTIDPKKLLSSGKQEPTGEVKQLYSMRAKNLSFV